MIKEEDFKRLARAYYDLVTGSDPDIVEEDLQSALTQEAKDILEKVAEEYI